MGWYKPKTKGWTAIIHEKDYRRFQTGITLVDPEGVEVVLPNTYDISFFRKRVIKRLVKAEIARREIGKSGDERLVIRL